MRLLIATPHVSSHVTRHVTSFSFVTCDVISMFFLCLVVVSTVDVISAHFGLSCRDIVLTFSSEPDSSPPGGALISGGDDDDDVGYDVLDNSVKRRRTMVVVDDVTTDWSSGASWSPPSTLDVARNGRRPSSNHATIRSDEAALTGSSSSKHADACRRLQLTTANQKLCTGSDGASVGQSLMEAVRLSVSECRRLFMHDRWNCSIEVDRHRVAILDRGFRESSLLHAISSAALVHTAARACSRGHLHGCTCDRSRTGSAPRQMPRDSTWRWAGCGDNVRYASRLAMRVAALHGRRSTSGRRRGGGGTSTTAELLSRIDEHNYNVGITTVARNLKEICKCHGVSASCATRTCWRQLTGFPAIANQLRTAYDQAVSIAETVQSSNDEVAAIVTTPTTVTSTSVSSGVRRRSKIKTVEAVTSEPKRRRPTVSGRPLRPVELAPARTLVYAADSPDYCERSAFSLGTRDRQCPARRAVSGPDTSAAGVVRSATTTLAGDRCDELCCGRGHNVRLATVRRRCRCHVVWCCDVKCDECVDEIEIFTCK